MAARGPVRPPRIAKRQQESSGLLMSVIRTLSSSQDNDQRDREKAKLEKEFKRSDQRLDDLVSEHQEALQTTMQSFSKIASRVTASRERIIEVKDKLSACKMLLHCKRDELKKLWLEGIEHKHVLFLLEQIETLKDISQKVDESMESYSYLQATELLVQAVSLLDGSLEGVDALKDVRIELQAKKDNLYEVLLEELNGHLYNLQLPNSSAAGLRSQSISSPSSHWKTIQSLSPTHKHHAEPDNSILTVVQCLHKLNRVPDAVENVKERCQSQLLSVIRSIVKQFSADTVIPQSSQSAVLLNDFLQQVFIQFKKVVLMHEDLLDKVRKVLTADGQHTDVHLYSIAEIWSKVQAVLETVIGEYLDIGNTSSGRQPAHPVFTETSADIATFFARKRNVKPKKYSLFRFDSSSHAININNYLKEQKQEEKESNPENTMDVEHKLVCEPHARNITVIYKPCMRYVEEIEQILQYTAGNHCPLHSFLMDCVKVFVGQISETITNNIESTTKSSDAWKPLADPETHDLANLTRPLLQSTVMLDKMISDLKGLILSLPVCMDEFLELMCSVLRNYKETCLDAYRGIVQPESEDKRIISATWAKDEDISRLLKNLPNWITVQQKNWNSEQEESPEEVELRNTRESQILTGNLGDVLIPRHEILSDVSQLRLLAQLQESMEWFGRRVLDLSRELHAQMKPSSPESPTLADEDFDINKLELLSQEFQEIGDTCLLVLHLEIRVHCFYHVLPIIQQGTFASGIDMQEPDPEVIKLNRDLCAVDEALTASLQPRKCRYVFEGLGHLISNIIISGIQHIKRINENGIKKMCRNVFAIQQNLTNITMSREVGLDKARQCFELMYFSLEEIIDSIVEHGAQFTLLEYSNVLNLIHRSTPGNDPAILNSHLERLNDLLCDGAVTV